MTSAKRELMLSAVFLDFFAGAIVELSIIKWSPKRFDTEALRVEGRPKYLEFRD